MIDLQPLYENAKIIDDITFIILIGVFIILSIISIILVKSLNKKFNFKLKSIPIILILFVLYVLFVVTVYPLNQDKYTTEDIRDVITENVKAKYGLNLSDNRINIFNMKDNIPSEKYFATFDNDSRIYEVYFVKNDNFLYLYTKNEKGVYLPVTTMMNRNIENPDTLGSIKSSDNEDLEDGEQNKSSTSNISVGEIIQ